MTNVVNLFKNADDYRAFAAGETIFDQGEVGDVMYVVIDGEVDITLGDELIDHLAPGSILGEMALIDKEPRSATATAITDCKVVPVDQKRFTFMIQQNPFFAIQVMSVMANRLRRLMGVSA